MTVSAEDELLWRSSDVQNFQEMSSSLYPSGVAKVSNVGNKNNNTPSTGSKNARKPRTVSGLKDAKKPAEVLSRGNDNIDVRSIQADVLWVSFDK